MAWSLVIKIISPLLVLLTNKPFNLSFVVGEKHQQRERV
jgi:hypothetical protein